jgi:hypothetical protein
MIPFLTRVVPLVAGTEDHIGFFRAPAIALVDADSLVALEDRSTAARATSTASPRVKRAPSPCMASPNNRA